MILPPGVRCVMRRCVRMPGLILVILVTCLAMAHTTAQELNISHQFHAEDDSRGRAAQVFANEAAKRSSELKILIHPQLSMGFTRYEQLEALQLGTLDFAILPFFVA